MGIWDRLFNVASRGGLESTYGQAVIGPVGEPASAATPRDHYRMLAAYYANNKLYSDLRRMLYLEGIESRAVKGLRNPTYRIVEVYPARVWGAPLADIDIVSEQPHAGAIESAVRQVWDWSNTEVAKDVGERTRGMLGDLFVRVATRGNPVDQVVMELVDPMDVPEFRVDTRGFVTWVRIDTQLDPDARGQRLWHTEVWDKAALTRRRWRHDKGYAAKLETLGEPYDTLRYAEAYGFNFVPVVHIPARQVLGETRGMAPVVPSLDKINEVNAIATRMHQQVYRHNKAMWALERAAGANTGDGRAAVRRRSEDRVVTLADETMLELPPGVTIKDLIPRLDYAHSLEIVRDMMLEIREDNPELAYYQLRNLREVSGRAAVILLGDFIDRLQAARTLAEHGMIRAQTMALTIGIRYRLFPELAGKTFERGELKHSFKARPLIHLADVDQSEARLAEINALVAEQGVTDKHLLVKLGYSEAEADEILRERASRASAQVFGAQLIAGGQVDEAGATAFSRGGADAAAEDDGEGQAAA